MGFFSWLLRKKTPKKIKVGLALGSGGAKGFAHLGALKAFEENGIEFDVIAGTSIGSIVGAFYADGYSSTDIMELLKRVNFGEVTNLFMMQMDTSGLYNVIKRELGDLEFSQLKKPFKAVATVLETGEEKVILFNLSGHGLIDMASYDQYFAGNLMNYELKDEEIQKNLEEFKNQ